MHKVIRKYLTAKIEFVGTKQACATYLLDNADRTYKGQKLIKISLAHYPTEKRKQGEYIV